MHAGAPPGSLLQARVPGLQPLPLLSAGDRFALEADDAVRRNLPGQMFFAYNAIHGPEAVEARLAAARLEVRRMEETAAHQREVAAASAAKAARIAASGRPPGAAEAERQRMGIAEYKQYVSERMGGWTPRRHDTGSGHAPSAAPARDAGDWEVDGGGSAPQGTGPSDYYVTDACPAETISVGLEARRQRKALRAALRRQRRVQQAAHDAKGFVDEADPVLQAAGEVKPVVVVRPRKLGPGSVEVAQILEGEHALAAKVVRTSRVMGGSSAWCPGGSAEGAAAGEDAQAPRAPLLGPTPAHALAVAARTRRPVRMGQPLGTRPVIPWDMLAGPGGGPADGGWAEEGQGGESGGGRAVLGRLCVVL